jgi:HPt (histidine-containing phosphotransfer) domain-containing protein
MDRGTVDESIDEERLSELLDVLGDADGGGLARAVDLFLSSVPPRLDELSAAAAAGRLGHAAGLAHSLRGSAGAFGASRLAALAAEVERSCAHAGAGAGALPGLVVDMEDEFASFRRVLGTRASGLVATGDAATASETEDGGR